MGALMIASRNPFLFRAAVLARWKGKSVYVHRRNPFLFRAAVLAPQFDVLELAPPS